FWRDRWYNVFRLSRPNCPLALWYCNVTTPAVFDGRHLSYVDLDLDVAVRPDGCVELLDEDEFEQHQRTYGYPAEVIARAEDAAHEVSQLARSGGFPFREGEGSRHSSSCCYYAVASMVDSRDIRSHLEDLTSQAVRQAIADGQLPDTAVP